MPPKRLSKIGSTRSTSISPSKTKSVVICPMCEEIIIDATATKKGHESILCDGVCGAWLHRCCAGLSKSTFAIVSKSNEKFFCTRCKLLESERELGSLKKRVDDLENKLDALLGKVEVTDSIQGSYASAVSSANEGNAIRSESSRSSPSLDMGRKYNVIVFGVDESPNGTSRADRQSKELNTVASVFSSVDSSITPLAIRDMFRLGKYNNDHSRSRPILVKLIRAADASSIIIKSRNLEPPYSVKPDRSVEERKKEKCLMDVRWSLIQSGYERKCIKIRNSSLFVKNQLV